MTTQYTPTLKLALPVTGELSGTWGDVVNQNITSMVEEAIAGLATISTWTSNAHTLTTANGTTAESRCAMLVASTGSGGTAITAAGTITCPSVAKLYVLKNGTSYAVTLKTAAGSGISVPAGTSMFLFCDGTNVNACETSANLISSTFNGTVGATTPSTGAFTTLSASGNGAIGGSLSPYTGAIKTLSVGGVGLVYGDGATFGFDVGIGQNVVPQDDGSFKYRTSSGVGVALYKQHENTHSWSVASAGTAGTAVTWTTPMTLNSSGLAVTGAIGSTGAIKTTGANLVNEASALKLSQESASGSYIMAYGANAATQGSLTVVTKSSDGSAQTVPAVFSSTGLAVTGACYATNWFYANTSTTGFSSGSGAWPLIFGINGTEKARIDTSGNLGLGVTPSAWTYKALEIGYAGNALWSSSTNDVRLSANLNYNSGYKYTNTGAATNYVQSAGAHLWYNAPSGTAGNVVTFTQAMALDASGNLLVGTSTAGTVTTGVQLWAGYGSNGNVAVGHASGTASGNQYSAFYYAGTVVGSITQSGTTAVAYNTTSDHRLKENVRPANAAKFNDIEFVDFEWVDGRHDCGVIAHQLQSVYPDLVIGEKDAVDEEGNPVYQQVNYIGLIARMGTKIQQLEARLSALENK